MTTNKPEATRISRSPKIGLDITVAPLGNERFEVDCRELKWWSIIPVVGNRASSAEYNPPDWRVALVRDMAAVRKALIHDIEGVEVEVRTWETGPGWRDSSHSFFGRIKDDAVQWLGAMYRNANETQVQTFLDEGFAWAFPEISRKLKDDGLFEISSRRLASDHPRAQRVRVERSGVFLRRHCGENAQMPAHDRAGGSDRQMRRPPRQRYSCQTRAGRS